MAREPLPLETWGNIWRSTSKEGTPTASAYYRDIDGKRRRIMRTAPTHAQAERKLKEAMSKRLAPTENTLTSHSKLGDAAEIWVTELGREKKSPATIRRYKSVVNSHLNKHVAEIRLNEMTVQRGQRIIDLIAASSVAQARMLGHALTLIFDMAIRYGAVDENPIRKTRLPEQTKKEVRAVNPDELAQLKKLLKTYDSQLAGREESIRDLTDIAEMILATGARIGEVLALQWQDVNIEAWTVTIRATLTHVEGKGLQRTTPKTRSSYRTLVLPPFIRGMLAKRYENAHVEWVFPSSAGKARWPENLRTQWREAVKDSPVEWVTPHDLRKTVATMLGPDAAKEQLGHSSLAVTDKHYIDKPLLRPDQTQVLETLGGFKVES